MRFFGSKRVVGLEIDTGEVRAVEMRLRGRALTLERWGRVQLPVDAVVDGVLIQPDPVAEALENLWAKGGFECHDIVLGVINQAVLMRMAVFPRVPADRLDGVIRHQAQEYLPLPVGGMVMDYQVIGDVRRNGDDVLEVLLVATRREMLDSYIQLLEEAGLRALDICVTPLALLKLLPEAAGEPVAVLDIANGQCSLVVTSGGVPRFARVISGGVAAGGGLTVFSGEERRTAGRSVTAVEPGHEWIEKLAGEVRSCLDYYTAQPDAAPVAALVLSGKGACVKTLPARLQELLGIPTRTLQPLTGIEVPAGESVFMSEANDFAGCLALARIGLGV